MGFSSIVSHVLWFLAALTLFGGMTDAWFDHQEDLREARQDRRVMDAERLHARLQAGSWCHTGDTIILNVTNGGRVPLNATDVTLVVDGSPLDDWTPDPRAAEPSHIWLPREEFYFNRTGIATEPDAIVLFTERGVPYYPLKLECRVLTTIVVTPAAANLAIGEEATFTAAGFDQYGDPIVDLAFTWSSAAGTVTQLSSTSARLTAGTTSGDFLMTATSGSVSGSADVAVRPDAPVSVSVSPDPVDVAAGSTQQFTSTALDQYGNVNATSTVTWSTTAGNITNTGLLTAQTNAQAARQVTATVDGLQDSATVNIVAGPLDHVTVTPSTPGVKTSATQQFSATGYDQYENPISGLSFTWGATRGSVDATGLYTAPATVGADSVTAASGGISGQATVAVTADLHVAAMPTYKNGAVTTSYIQGDTVNVQVTVRDQAENLQQGATVTLEIVRVQTGQVVYGATTAITDAGGVAHFNWTTASNQQRGDYSVRVTNISGTDFVYDSASNVGTPRTITIN